MLKPGRRGSNRPERKIVPSSKFLQIREHHLRNPSFVRKAMTQLGKNEPDLIQLFRSIPEQIKLTEKGKKALQRELERCAVEAELHRQGKWQFEFRGFGNIPVETEKGEASIKILKGKQRWILGITEE